MNINTVLSVKSHHHGSDSTGYTSGCMAFGSSVSKWRCMVEINFVLSQYIKHILVDMIV